MREDGHSGEGVFECTEGMATGIVEVPRRVLVCEMRERNDKVRIIMDKTAIEIGKAKE
jgi:hypothetical protein